MTSPNAEATTAETFDAAPPADSDSAATSQSAITAEILQIEAGYRASGVAELQPRLDYPPYRSSLLRHPTKDLHHADPETIELWAPVLRPSRRATPLEADLTIQHGGEPIGERIVVTGRVLDGDGRPVRGQLVEIWQANAAGRYIHKRDQHPAPIDPNFTGVGRCLTDDDGTYRFTTIKPGPYPWKNHRNAWRPAHIHFSLFGTEFTQRMVTQMYFPGDPLFALDPIYQSIVDPAARDRLVATLRPRRDPARVEHRLPLGHRAHRAATAPRWTRRMRREPRTVADPGPDRRPVLRLRAAVRPATASWCRPATRGAVRLHGRVHRRRGRAGARTRCSRSGRPTPTGRVVQQEPGRCAATAGRSPAGAARPPTTTGTYTFTTLRPGADAGRAPFFAVTRLRARAAEPAVHPRLPARDAAALAADPLLSSLPEPDRRRR